VTEQEQRQLTAHFAYVLHDLLEVCQVARESIYVRATATRPTVSAQVKCPHLVETRDEMRRDMLIAAAVLAMTMYYQHTGSWSRARLPPTEIQPYAVIADD
jgi:hypothetical protein